MSCTVPSVKGLITMNYEKSSDEYIINLVIPQGVKAYVCVPYDSVVFINSEMYYQKGEYINGGQIGNVEIKEK